MLCFGAMRLVLSPALDAILVISLTLNQVEYLVVKYSENEPRVVLSLRQAEILKALAADAELAKEGGCVPVLQDVNSKK